MLLPLNQFDPSKLRKVLADLGLSTELARDIEALLFVWHLAMQLHPSMSEERVEPLQGVELAIWERFYKEKRFLFQFISELVPVDRIASIQKEVSAKDDLCTVAEFEEFEPDGALQQSLGGRFIRHVVFPYFFWNQEGPWRDYHNAGIGNEKALQRLLAIDENVRKLPSLMRVWSDHVKADPDLYQRLWNAQNRVLNRVLQIDGDGQLSLKAETYASKKVRFMAKLAMILEDEGSSLTAPQLRSICDAFMAGWHCASDPTLSDTSDETLSRAIRRNKRDKRENSPSS